MSSLYKIQSDLLNLIEGEGYQAFVDEETGEFDEEGFQKALDELAISREEKIENCGLMIKKLTAMINELKAEEQALNERRKKKERDIERIKRNLFFALDGQAFETLKVAISFRNSTKVEITDESKLPKEFIKEKVTISADKNAIKEAIKEGKEVAGAELVEVQNLQIK